MAQPFSLAYRNQVADQILEALSDGPLSRRQIAEQIGLPDKETYKHLVFMAEMLGVVRKEKSAAANAIGRVVTLWIADGELIEPRNDIKRIHRIQWPRGEHGRDWLVAALFGAE